GRFRGRAGAEPPLSVLRLFRVRRLRAALPGRRLHQPRLPAVPDPGRPDDLVHAAAAVRAAAPLARDQRADPALEAQGRMTGAVIAGYVRSPFQPARKGELVDVRPDELCGQIVRALVKRSGVDPATLEDVTVGCAFPEGEQGMNVGRIAGVLAGLPRSVAGATINRFCGSSMQAVHSAAGSIAAG